MKKIDIVLSLITGEVAAWFFFGIFKKLGVEAKALYWVLPVLFPILSLLGLWICFLLRKKFLWIFQVAKFFLIGVLATLVDLEVLSILIFASGATRGLYYSVFKGISFLFATCVKYSGDKFWVFEKMEKKEMGKEFGQFLLVTLVGMGINVGIASLVVNLISPPGSFSPEIWATFGAIVAAFGAAAWNFLGYKFVVFKK